MNSRKNKIQEIDKLPQSFKGYEIYVWTDMEQENYKLVTGSNYLKSDDEILKDEFKVDSLSVRVLVKDINELEALLSKIPEGTYISLNSGKWWDENISKSIEESDKSDDILKLSEELNIIINH